MAAEDPNKKGLKVALLGGGGVGKSNITMRMINDTFKAIRFDCCTELT